MMINELLKQIHQINVKNGFYEGESMKTKYHPGQELKVKEDHWPYKKDDTITVKSCEPDHIVIDVGGIHYHTIPYDCVEPIK